MANFDNKFGSKEGQKQLMEDLKSNSEILGLVIENPNLRYFLKSKGLKVFGELETKFLPYILLSSINIESYDRRFQKYLQNSDITFFSELNTLMNYCTDKSKKTTLEILNQILNQSSIYQLKKDNTDIKMTFLFNYKISNLIEKYTSQHPLNLKEFMQEVYLVAKETQEKSINLNKYPNEFEKVAENVINEIKNNWECTRFLSGMIRAFFELLNNNLKPLKNYFSERFSAKWHYQGPSSYRGQKCCWISDYLNPKLFKSQADKYKSMKIVFEDWLFRYIEKLRHFKSHSERDLIQDKLEEGIYKVKIKENKKYIYHEYTLHDLESFFEQSYDFLLLSKHIIARKLYQNDKSLIDYLLKPYNLN